MLGRQDSVRGNQRQGAAARPLPKQQGHRRRMQVDHVGDASSDFSCEPTFLGFFGQRSSGRVDDGDQGQLQVLCEAHTASCFAQRRRSERGEFGLSSSVLAEEDAGHVAESDQRQDEPGVCFALTCSVERQYICGSVEQ